MTGALISEQILSDADLLGTNFAAADLTGTDLTGANLRAAHFEGACLRGADLRHCDLRDANFQMADLRAADLRELNGERLDLRNADLRGARFTERFCLVQIFGVRTSKVVLESQYHGTDARLDAQPACSAVPVGLLVLPASNFYK